jgi:hypothetical protein
MKILFRYPSEKSAFSEVLSASLLLEFTQIFSGKVANSAFLLGLVIIFAHEQSTNF